MTALRRPTNHNGTNQTDTPLGTGGVTKHCMKCDTWRPPGGFKKNKRTGMMECPNCVAKREAK